MKNQGLKIGRENNIVEYEKCERNQHNEECILMFVKIILHR